MARQADSPPFHRDDPPPIAQRCPRVFILSDLRLLREGVALALASHPSVKVVGSSALSEPPDQLAQLKPHVLILDITLPASLDRSGAIRALMPELKIVALGVAEVEQVVMDCAEAGVSGFVAPDGSAADVVTAVHSAMRGELVCSPRMAGMLLNRVTTHLAQPPTGLDNEMLTPREREIGSLMSEGLSNKHIARQLGIQNATVKNHVHSILSKMRVHRRGEAAAQFLHCGLQMRDAFPQFPPPPPAHQVHRPPHDQST